MTNKKTSGGLNAFVNEHIMPVAAKIGNFKLLIAVFVIVLQWQCL